MSEINPEEIIKKSYESQEIPDSSVDLAWAKFQKTLPPQHQNGKRRILLFTIIGVCISLFLIGYISINNNQSANLHSTTNSTGEKEIKKSDRLARDSKATNPGLKTINENLLRTDLESEHKNNSEGRAREQFTEASSKSHTEKGLKVASKKTDSNQEVVFTEPNEIIAYEEIKTQESAVQTEENIENTNAIFWNTDIVSRPITPRLNAFNWGGSELIPLKSKYSTGMAPGMELVFRLGVSNSLIARKQLTEKIIWPNTQLGMMYNQPINRRMFGGLGLTAGFSGRNTETSVWNNKQVKRDSFGRELTTVDSVRFILKSFSYFSIPLRWGFKADRFRFMLGTDLRFKYSQLLRNNILYQLDDSIPVPRLTLISDETKKLRTFSAVPDVVLFLGVNYTRGHHSFGISYNPEVFMQYKTPEVMGLNRIPGKPQMRQEWTFNYAFRLY